MHKKDVFPVRDTGASEENIGALLRLLITWLMSCFICEETAFILNYLFLFYFFVEQGDGRGVFVLCYKLQWQYLGITTKSIQNVSGTKNPWLFCLTFVFHFPCFFSFAVIRNAWQIVKRHTLLFLDWLIQEGLNSRMQLLTAVKSIQYVFNPSQ